MSFLKESGLRFFWFHIASRNQASFLTLSICWKVLVLCVEITDALLMERMGIAKYIKPNHKHPGSQSLYPNLMVSVLTWTWRWNKWQIQQHTQLEEPKGTSSYHMQTLCDKANSSYLSTESLILRLGVIFFWGHDSITIKHLLSMYFPSEMIRASKCEFTG